MKKLKTYEDDEQRQVVDWFHLQYPNDIINIGLGGIKLPIGLAVKIKRNGHLRSFPDIFIYKPNSRFAGLAIEFKRTGEKIYRKDGTLRKIEHLQRQQEMLNLLNNKGYYAVFSIGFKATTELIKQYMEIK